MWKKILRDLREFYRILFRVRFHYLDYKDKRGAQKWVQVFFHELGIPITQEEIKDAQLFAFLHQSHKNKKKYNDQDSVFTIIEEFNELTRVSFMSHPLATILFYFLYTNFLHLHTQHIAENYKERILCLIGLALRCYKKMTHTSHLKRIKFLVS